MRMNEVVYTDIQPIDGYGPGFFRYGGQVFEGPILVGPGGRAPWQGIEDHDPLLALKGQIDVLFLGMGAEIAHAPEPLRRAIEEAGIGIETMSSPAAARSYNVLIGEGRRIAAALLPLAA